VATLSINKATPSEDIKVQRGNDRILKLKVIDGEKPISSLGLVDPRLFTGENKLHALLEDNSSLWHLKYDSGTLPAPLRQRFTGYSKLVTFVRDYFARRNVEVEEVIHAD